MRVTPRRIYQLKKQYEETGQIPELKQPGRKPKQIDKEAEQIILQAYKKVQTESSSTGKADRKRLLHSHPSQHHIQSFTQTRSGGGEHEQEKAKEVGSL